MRVPIWIVIPLCLAVIGTVWFTQTRQMDFLTPPTEAELATIRAAARERFPKPLREGAPGESAGDGGQVAEVFDFGDLKRAPVLSEFADQAGTGAGHLVDLAMALETAGQPQRARLAWERVLDFTEPSPDAIEAAVEALGRFSKPGVDSGSRPPDAIEVVLHAGASPTMGEALGPVLEEVAAELDAVSSGYLKVRAELHLGKPSDKPESTLPIALWFTGEGEGALSTEVRAFMVASADALRIDLLRAVYLLIQQHLGQVTNLAPVSEPGEGENWANALETRVTRLAWNQFGTALNLTPGQKKLDQDDELEQPNAAEIEENSN